MTASANSRQRTAPLFAFDPRALDHVGPFRGFLFDVLSEEFGLAADGFYP